MKGYIDAGTCNTVTFADFSSSECGDSASSYYKEFTYNGKRVVITNNVSSNLMLALFQGHSNRISAKLVQHTLYLSDQDNLLWLLLC